MKPKNLITRKPVEYFGMSFLVQSGMKYIAVDELGEVYAFTHKPILRDTAGRWIENSLKYEGTDLEFLGTVNLEKGEDWRDTLRKL